MAKKKVRIKKSQVRAQRVSAPATVVTEYTNLTTLTLMLVAMFVVNTLVIFAADIVAGPMVVLGTHMLSPIRSLVQSMLVFSVLLVATTPVIEAVQSMFKLKLQTMHWMAIYFVLNAAFLWVVARGAEMLGLGIANWQIIAILAIVLDVVQGFAVQYVMKKA